MRMSVANLDSIRDWAIRNQGALPQLTLRLTFATDLARSVIEQDAAPDPQRVIEIGYDIGNLMWRIRSEASPMAMSGTDGRSGPAAGTRVIREAIRRGLSETGDIEAFVESHVGRTVEVMEVVGHEPSLDMPEFGARPIAVEKAGDVFVFTDAGETPCRTSKIRGLSAAIGRARRDT